MSRAGIDLDGKANSLSTQGTWVQRVVDLSMAAGQYPVTIALGVDAGTGAGASDLYIADVSFIQPDGTVIPLYNGHPFQGRSGEGRDSGKSVS